MDGSAWRLQVIRSTETLQVLGETDDEEDGEEANNDNATSLKPIVQLAGRTTQTHSHTHTCQDT